MIQYDAEIEYLESTGTQYINTGIKAGTYTYYYKGYLNNNTNQVAFGAGSTAVLGLWAGGYVGLQYGSNKQYYAASSSGISYVKNGLNEIFVTPNYIEVNGRKYNYDKTYTISSNNIVCLFSDINNNYRFKNRIYNFKIINDNAVLLDLIPVRIGSVGYMYDKVSDKLFGNAGTGSFILGPDTKLITNTGRRTSKLRRRIFERNPKHIPTYLCFTAIDEGTFSFTMNSGFGTGFRTYVEYSIDEGKTWNRTNNVNNTEVVVTTPLIKPGQKVYWKGVGNTSANNNGWAQTGRFSSTGRFNVSGILSSFFYGDNFSKLNKTKSSYYAARMFLNCKIIHSKDLILSPCNHPFVYYDMFQGCNMMIDTPNFNNMNVLTGSCYRGMFGGCRSLQNLPTLPNIPLANACYYYMFSGCSSLIEIPSNYLPATTLASTCYCRMFNACTSLTMAPNLPATTLASDCYNGMFYGCTSLRIAPELPAITLVSNCYTEMFRACTNLNYIKAMFTTTPSTSYTNNWVYQVQTSDGLFIRNPEATWWVVGQHGIPSGWVLEDGTEQNDDIIVFEDEEAKRVITSRYGGITPAATYRTHWPVRIRGKVDGEITYRQAAHIASITSAFENNTVVKKFHEFQYFTGINGSGDKWFQKCTSLEEITLPNKNNLSIAANAFFQCKNITIFNNWEKVVTLNDHCFREASGSFRTLLSNLDYTNIKTWAGSVLFGNTLVTKLYLPSITSANDFYNIGNCELLDIGHDNPISFGVLLFWGWNNTKSTNLVFRCPCVVKTNWSGMNMHNNAGGHTFNLFVYQKYYDTYANDPYWSTADNIYVIGGEEWVDTFGSSDEWADYPNGQAPNIDLTEGELEYLRPKSNYAFNTGVTPTINTKMVTKARYATLTNSEIAGTYLPTTERFHFGCYGNKFYFGVGNTYKQVKDWDTNVHTFELSGNGTAAIDDTTYSIDETLGTATTTISIFARHGSSYTYNTSTEIYNFKIYENEELIRDYVPYLYRGYACLKNKITGTFGFIGQIGNFDSGPIINN